MDLSRLEEKHNEQVDKCSRQFQIAIHAIKVMK